MLEAFGYLCMDIVSSGIATFALALLIGYGIGLVGYEIGRCKGYKEGLEDKKESNDNE